MLVLSRSDVVELLDLRELIDALAGAMSDLSGGRASVPPRIGAMVPERDGILGAMPGYVPSSGALVCKLVTLFPGNAGTELPTHQAVIAVFDPATGAPLALLDGTEITAARTGAASALSARLLAREDASVLAVLGTGVQARSHARAMVLVRPIREVRVAGRDREKAAALADELAAELGVEARSVGSYEEAIAGAQVVCATTHSAEPVVRREWLDVGTHVTSVGFTPDGREVDDGTVAAALVCVESRSAVLAPPPAGSNDVIEPVRSGLISEDEIVEVGELVAGTRPGRASADQITLYKSVGVAVQDAAAAALVLARAAEAGRGATIQVV
jgi:ornithine cyclodeaminase/alanine dehydrogenase-like protein (mu-crystallin family)